MTNEEKPKSVPTTAPTNIFSEEELREAAKRPPEVKPAPKKKDKSHLPW